MKAENSKLVLGLLAGAAIGAAVAYLLTSDKKEHWLDEAGSLIEKAKGGIKDITESVKSSIEKSKCCDKAQVVTSEEIVVE